MIADMRAGRICRVVGYWGLFLIVLSIAAVVAHSIMSYSIPDAVAYGNLRKTRIMLTLDPWLSNTTFYNSRLRMFQTSILIKAVEIGRPDLAELILDKGADPNWVDWRGFTALHYAAIDDSMQLTELLLSRGADPNRGSKDGPSALHYAARLPTPLIVRALLLNGADVNARDHLGKTPLAWALQKARKENAQLLRDATGQLRM